MKIAKSVNPIIPFAVVSILALGLGVAGAQLPEDTPQRLASPALDKLPDFGFPKGKTVYVDGTSGRDLPQCGTRQMPCLTISQGLNRARQIQDSPVAPDEPVWMGTPQTGVTVEVGPGSYDESVMITSNYIFLHGSGPESSVITARTTPYPYAARVHADPVQIEGFTFRSSSSYAVVVATGANVSMTNCEFADSLVGLSANHARVSIAQSRFTNNQNGVVALDGSIVRLTDVSITGRGNNIGTGIWAQVRSVVLLGSSPGTLHSITNYLYGVFAEDSTVNVLRYRIAQNKNGVLAVSKAYVWFDYGAVITDNLVWGAEGRTDSFFEVVGDVEIRGNGGATRKGISLRDFSRCVIVGVNQIIDPILKDDSSDFRIR